MSEHETHEEEHETHEATPDEETTPDETDTPDETREEESEEPDERETEAFEDAPRVPSSSIEAQRKQQDKDRVSIAKENKRHADRLRQIMGEDAAYNVACPLCNSSAKPVTEDDQYVEPDEAQRAGELVSGYLFVTDGGVIGDDKVQRLKELLGVGLPSDLKQHPTVHKCETCDGRGECATGSARQGYEAIQCPTCDGKGWEGLGVSPTAIAPTNGSAEPAALTGPTVYTTDSHVDTFKDDPQVAALRERGFMVIPPMNINAG